MQDHWKHSGPPVYIAVAAYLKLIKKRSDRSRPGMPAKPTAEASSEASQRISVRDMMRDRAELAQFARDFGAAGGRQQ